MWVGQRAWVLPSSSIASSSWGLEISVVLGANEDIGIPQQEPPPATSSSQSRPPPPPPPRAPNRKIKFRGSIASSSTPREGARFYKAPAPASQPLRLAPAPYRSTLSIRHALPGPQPSFLPPLTVPHLPSARPDHYPQPSVRPAPCARTWMPPLAHLNLLDAVPIDWQLSIAAGSLHPDPLALARLS